MKNKNQKVGTFINVLHKKFNFITKRNFSSNQTQNENVNVNTLLV